MHTVNHLSYSYIIVYHWASHFVSLRHSFLLKCKTRWGDFYVFFLPTLKMQIPNLNKFLLLMLKMIGWINEESSGNKSCKMMHNIIRAKGYRKIFQILSLGIFLLFFLTTNLPKAFKEMIMNISVRSYFLSNSEGKGRRLCFWLWR